MAFLLARALGEVKGVGQHDPDKRTPGGNGSNSSKCAIFATLLLLTRRKFQLDVKTCVCFLFVTTEWPIVMATAGPNL